MPNGLTWTEVERVNARTLLSKLGPKKMYHTDKDVRIGGELLAEEIRRRAGEVAWAIKYVHTAMDAGNSLQKAVANIPQIKEVPKGLTYSDQELKLANELAKPRGDFADMVKRYSESCVLVIRGIPGDPDYENGYPNAEGLSKGNR